jgi:GDP-D-mannose 3', 5'-epimerase
MRVLVTGGGGFIGSHIVARLATDGHDVIAVDRVFPEMRREWWQHATFRASVDLSTVSLHRMLAGIDHVLHFAADMGGVGYFHSAKDAPASQHNLRVDLNVLKACRDANVPLFYASSACMYPASRVPLHEGLIGKGPADRLYGEVKRFMTLLLIREPLARVGVFHTIYGPGQEWDGDRVKFPAAICRKVKRDERIDIWGDGSQTRTFLYIDDAVEKILTVALSDVYQGPVNIGSDEEVTIRQCADWLCEHAGREPDYTFSSDRPVGMVTRGCDNGFYDRLYGRTSLTSARTGLARMYEWLPAPASVS